MSKNSLNGSLIDAQDALSHIRIYGDLVKLALEQIELTPTSEPLNIDRLQLLLTLFHDTFTEQMKIATESLDVALSHSMARDNATHHAALTVAISVAANQEEKQYVG